MAKKNYSLSEKNGVHEFKFDSGEWVSISEGGWEYQEDEDDEDSYSEGGLWFENRELVDFDGAFELPKLVIFALKKLRYKIDPDFE